jgi:tetratricopeptide (TPR) repeat protein
LLIGAALAASLATGCGSRASQSTVPTTPDGQVDTDDSSVGAVPDSGTDADADAVDEIDLEPLRIEVVGEQDGEPILDAFDARTLLDRGNAALAERRYDDALAAYEKLLADFPDSYLASTALYNIGLVYEAEADLDGAIAQYQRLVDQIPTGRDAIDAQVRIAALFAELERWGDSEQAISAVLEREDLDNTDRVEAYARLGYVLIEQKQYTRAEASLRDAVDIYDKATRLDTNYYIAMAYYYLGEIPHRQFLAAPLRLPDDQLKKDLASKRALLDLAYDRYKQGLEFQLPYWQTACGYQMSQLYKEFWDAVVSAPVPPQLSPEASEIYVREVHKVVFNMLREAFTGHSRVVELAEAYKVPTVWSEASKVRANEIADILARETSGEMVVPEVAVAETPEDLGEGPQPAEYIPGRIEL